MSHGHHASHDRTFDAVHTIDQIREAWRETSQEVQDVFGSCTESEFTADRDGQWTLSKNLDHLTRSGLAVAGALGMPKLLIRLLFGRGQDTRSLSEVRTVYQQALAQGGQARGRYVPQNAVSQQEALDQWNHCSDLLLKNLGRWTDAQLDSHRLPHPLIGRLTVREMLFFTIFHTQHHLRNVHPD